MTSTKERQQRAAARARLAREMAERLEAARRRRRRQVAIGAGAALVLIFGGVAWALAMVSDDGEPEVPAAQDTPEGCVWLPEQPGGNPTLQDVGTPPTDEPPAGKSTMTITTNHGVIEVELDTGAIPCTAASFAYLSEQGFYDGSTCHRLTTEGIHVLQCGDPSGTGMGGPTYRYAEENLPVDQDPTYPRGTVAMAKTQAPSSTGSQFFLVYEDAELPPDYTVVGTVTQGMEIIDKIAAGGAVDLEGESVPDGIPEIELKIETLEISDPA